MKTEFSPVKQDVTITKNELKEIKQEVQEELLFNRETTSSTPAVVQETQNDEEISLKEGLKLFGQGALQKVKDMGSAIVKHPVKTLAAAAGTTAVIAAAPLVGITSATAGAALAVGFGAVSIFKAGSDVKETVDDYQEGKFDEVREDIKELGSDGVDLAMALPFMPKAAKQLTRTAKYGTSTIGLNTSLISDLKNISNFDDVVVAFGKANAKINYEMIGNEAGLSVKPELTFEKSANNKLAAQFEPTTGKIIYNENALSAKNLAKNPMTQDEILRHELKHFEQFSELARANGPEAVSKTMSEYYTKIMGEEAANAPIELAKLKQATEDMWHEHNSTLGKSIKELNKQSANVGDDIQNFAQNVDEFGKGEPLTPYESKADFTKLDEMIKKMNDIQDEIELNQKTIANLESGIEMKNKTLTEAGLDARIARNMTSGDKSAFNQSFWDDVVASQGSTSNNPEAIAKASEYAKEMINKGCKPDQALVDEIIAKYNITCVDGWLNTRAYQKAQLELYKTNLLEKEAYATGAEFAKQNFQAAKGALIDNVMAVGLAQETFNEDDKNLLEIAKETIQNKKLINPKTSLFGVLGTLLEE